MRPEAPVIVVGTRGGDVEQGPVRHPVLAVPFQISLSSDIFFVKC